MAYAHSKNEAGKRHDLVEHLTSVAEMARGFADRFGGGDLAYWAGMWHDLGKFHPDFQKYLRKCEMEPGKRHPTVDHKRAGAKVAWQWLKLLAMLVKGHHGGLPASRDLPAWITEESTQEAVDLALKMARATTGVRLNPPAAVIPPSIANDVLGAELFFRMIFSALVDADCLDTERHFNPDKADIRTAIPTLAELWPLFKADQARMVDEAKADDTRVNQLRRDVYAACLAAAGATPGFFRLAVPTGGGKTRSGLAFAIRHALAQEQQLERVIIAAPYTSIIEQTADVYRSIFHEAKLGSGEQSLAVLEHHSAILSREGDEDAAVTPILAWQRLAAQNWYAPIVVTTTVQLFESLLGDRTGACRKLHNIARSVIILDEVQTLPPHLLDPLLDVVRRLVAEYGVSVVLCTATQPGLDESPKFRGLPNVRMIIPNSIQHFIGLERVSYEWPCLNEPWGWARVAEEMPVGSRVMTVVNTKADALALLDALNDPMALHLSTLLCGAHRRVVLKEVRRRLKSAEPCRLVATQVVEAGVDIDFPLVLRSLGPLDRIAQAAGRCNREGTLAGKGRVVIFETEEDRQPPGAYRIGSDIAKGMIRAAGGKLDPNDPMVFVGYFQEFYRRSNLDREDIQKMRRSLDYPEVAKRFRLIDEEGESLIVKYRGGGKKWLPAEELDVEELIRELRDHPQRSGTLLRQLQPYIVNVRRPLLGQFQDQGLALEVLPGLWEWFGDYDDVRGLGGGRSNAANLVLSPD